MKKYSYIDLVRTIAMFGVILCHSLLFFSRNPFWFVNADYENDIATFLFNILNFTVVPIFVFCSGFLLQASMQRKKLNITTAVLERAKRLLLPYLLYGFLWLVPTYTLFDIPTYGRPKGSSLINGYKSMLLGRFCDVAWFLLMLFWVSLIWITLRSLLEKKRFIIGAVAAAALYFAAHYLLAGVNCYTLNQIDIYLVIFFAGASFFWIAEKTYELSLSVLISVSLFGMLVCAMLSPFTSLYHWLYCVLSIVMPLIMVIFAMALCKFKLMTHAENSQIYKWLLKHNMDIYLMQAPGMYLSFMLFYPIVGQYCAFCVIISYIFTIAIDFILVLLLSYIRRALPVAA